MHGMSSAFVGWGHPFHVWSHNTPIAMSKKHDVRVPHYQTTTPSLYSKARTCVGMSMAQSYNVMHSHHRWAYFART